MDLFAPIQQQERDFRENLERGVRADETKLEILSRILQLQENPGYKEFAQRVVSLRDTSNKELIAAEDRDRMLRLQGQTIAFDEILQIMHATAQEAAVIQSQLKQRMELRRKQIRPDGKVIPQPISLQGT